MNFEVYCDGSATTADKPGGYGFVLVQDGTKFGEGCGHLSKATNNVAEITAAIRGLEQLSKSSEYTNALAAVGTGNVQQVTITLVSDSQLTLRYATGEYTCRKYHLQLLCSQLKAIYQRLGATTRWVKGHNGDEHNERCDVLAKEARNDPTK